MSRPRKGVKEAVLEYHTSAFAPDGSASLADISLHTGRTHQIRVQFASRRHPLWGDGKYGSRIKGDIALQSARPVSYTHLDVYKRQVPPQLEEQPVALEMYIFSPNSWVIRRA